MEDNTPKFIEITNEDGTSTDDMPSNPLLDKYPACASHGYQCMFCSKCPRGDGWKTPEEDREVQEEHSRKRMEYMKEHNPRMYNMIVAKK